MPSASDPRQQNRTRQPAPRPAQPGQRSAQPTQRAAQQPATRPSQPAGGARFKQQAPAQRTQGRARQSRPHTHHVHGSYGVAPATRSSYKTHACRGAQKKSSPVPMIIGGVVAVLALVAIVFFVVPAVKGFFAGEDTKVAAGQQVTITIPDGASGDTIASILSENHIVENPKDYYAAVKKLNAYYMLEGIQPVISVAQNAIKDILNETQPVPVTIEKIVGEVSRTFNVSPADIRGTKRNANVASARRVAIYILREVTGMSMEEIGREFSGRDHSTIVYSLKTMERDMKNDQHLRETVSDIIKNVKA